MFIDYFPRIKHDGVNQHPSHELGFSWNPKDVPAEILILYTQPESLRDLAS